MAQEKDFYHKNALAFVDLVYHIEPLFATNGSRSVDKRYAINIEAVEQ